MFRIVRYALIIGPTALQPPAISSSTPLDNGAKVVPDPVAVPTKTPAPSPTNTRCSGQQYLSMGTKPVVVIPSALPARCWKGLPIRAGYYGAL